MRRTREEIMIDILNLLHQLADDWEYSQEITSQTRFFADMGLASLDVVVLGAAVQEYYGQVLPFSEIFAEVGQRDLPDIPVGEWVDFVYEHLNQVSGGEPELGGE
jgi:acyl carrier protein